MVLSVMMKKKQKKIFFQFLSAPLSFLFLNSMKKQQWKIDTYLFKDTNEVQLPKMAICNGSEIESVAHNGKIFAKFQLSLTQNASNLTNKQWQINHYIFISMKYDLEKYFISSYIIPLLPKKTCMFKSFILQNGTRFYFSLITYGN